MKRLNPETGKPFVRGDLRADGFLFNGYHAFQIKKNGYFSEIWLSPKSFAKRNKYFAAWHQENKPKRNDQNRQWCKNNPDKMSAKWANRRASKLRRTPPWLTQEHLQQIESVYALAKRLTADTGIMHHVDHIVPLQGKTVSGLHVPWNLRAIPAMENLIKSNHHD